MKAVVIGTGFGSRVVAPIYEKSGIEVEVVSPRDEAAIQAACASDADFVSVHSPPFLHRDHVLTALGNGKDVVCDKPFGRSAGEARDMLDAAEAAGAIHLLNFEFRHEGARKKAKQLIDQGAIGKVKHLQCFAMMSASRHPVQPYRWLWNRELGGGWIGAFGSHIIDAFRWWAGEIATATGVLRNELPYRPDKDGKEQPCTGEDAFSACFTFDSGATGLIEAAYAASVSRPWTMEVFGDDGAIRIVGSGLVELARPDGDDQRFEFPAPQGDIHEPAMTAWTARIIDSVRDRRQIEPSFRDGLACAEVMDKLRANSVWVSQA